MAETLGSLCDKLTIVKLKQFHTEDPVRLESLSIQESQLTDEINSYIKEAFSGAIPVEKLSFASNKVYKESEFILNKISGGIGHVIAELAKINCELWHEQEKVYDFESIPVIEKNNVVKKLASLNLGRVQCIDEINKILIELCQG